VYMPAARSPCCRRKRIERFSLTEGAEALACSSISMLRPDDFRDRVSPHPRERVRIAANLRHQAVENLIGGVSFRHVAGDIPYSRELNTLWKFAGALERGRWNILFGA